MASLWSYTKLRIESTKLVGFDSCCKYFAAVIIQIYLSVDHRGGPLPGSEAFYCTPQGCKGAA